MLGSSERWHDYIFNALAIEFVNAVGDAMHRVKFEEARFTHCRGRSKKIARLSQPYTSRLPRHLVMPWFSKRMTRGRVPNCSLPRLRPALTLALKKWVRSPRDDFALVVFFEGFTEPRLCHNKIMCSAQCLPKHFADG